MAKRRRHGTRQKTEKILNAVDLEAAPRPAPGRTRRGSIEQQLDMCEEGPLRGDEILHQHGIPDPTDSRPPLDDNLLQENYQIDMSEEWREGDEESGDEHSAGHQGSDQQELQYDTEDPEDSDSGSPGEMTQKLAHLDPSRKGYRKRAA